MQGSSGVWRDGVVGALLGLALGDAHGAPREGGWPERLVWALLGTTWQGRRRWTDDTQMAWDVAQWLLQPERTLDDLATRFAASHRWSRGYGPSTTRVLSRIRRGQPWQQAAQVLPGGSWGNGAAMRAPVVGLWCAHGPEQLVALSDQVAQVTHAHPLAVHGARLLAWATWGAVRGQSPLDTLGDLLRQPWHPPYREQLLWVANRLERKNRPTTDADAMAHLGCGTAAAQSCAMALWLAWSHWHQPFEALLQRVNGLRGDVDTVAAMAGAVWGAGHGVLMLPQLALAQLEQVEALKATAEAMALAIDRAAQTPLG